MAERRSFIRLSEVTVVYDPYNSGTERRYDRGVEVSQVVLFSTSTCSWCRRAKRYLRENRVRFKEVNIERDPKASQDLLKKTGQMGVPVIKIGGRWIVGFDQPAIEKELARLS